MMDGILRELMDLQGVHASLVFDSTGQILAFQGSPIYDRALLEGASALLSKAMDSVELLHSDWDSMQASFGDGALMIRNLGSTAQQQSRAVLVVLADSSLNRSFATVAMRVGVQKLKQALAAPPPLPPSQSVPPLNSGMGVPAGGRMSAPLPPPPPPAAFHPYQSQPPTSQWYPPAPPAQMPGPHTSQMPGPHSSQMPGQPVYGQQPQQHPGSASNLDGSDYGLVPGMRQSGSALGYGQAPTQSAQSPSNSGLGSNLAWSGIGGSRGSSLGVAVADQESLELLTKLSKALAPFVGPMAKVFVKEAVREVCRDAPFSALHAQEVVRTLKSNIEYANDREQFAKTARSIVGAP